MRATAGAKGVKSILGSAWMNIAASPVATDRQQVTIAVHASDE